MTATPARPPAALPLSVLNHSCCLGVERSVTGRRWLLRATDERLAETLSQRLGLPAIVGRVLAARNIGLAAAEPFLDPTLRRLLPDPGTIRDMDRASERLARAVVAGETVTVFADYDVDGATSAGLLCRFLAAAGRPAGLYVPDRLSEGYGPNAAALCRLAAAGTAVVVTVDCGSSAHDALAAAAGCGLDVIVVDHHAIDGALPPAVAVVNPNRPDDTSGLGGLAAVGVAFMLAVATNRTLRAAGWYRDRPEPDLRRWLDLVALGTVCDLAPLTGLNRALVTQGLKVLAQWGNPGLKALAAIAGLSAPPTTDHAGFIFGPRINAAGRIGDASLGARLLISDDPVEAAEIARRLDATNAARREIEAAVAEEAAARIAASGQEEAAVIFIAGDGWHPGVVGIVASRLAERYRKPACVLARRDGTATGSGRSIAGVDLGAAVLAACEAGLLMRGGGHAMAAGFTVAADKLSAFQDFLIARLAGDVAAATRSPQLLLDGALPVSVDTGAVADQVERIAPFGSGNAEPRFAIAAARVAGVSSLRGGHVRCTLAGAHGSRLDAIAFRAEDGPIAAALRRHDGAPLHLAGRLRRDPHTGRGKLIIDDVASPYPLTAADD